MGESFDLNVYDKSGKVIKKCTAKGIDLEFGTIRSLMELLNVDNVNDTAELLRTVYGAWDEVTGLLDQCFPDMKKSDWDHVKVKELIPLLVDVLKYSFAEMLMIPKEKN